MNQPKTIAIFDFDNTLAEGDSFLPFLACVIGWKKVIIELTRSIINYVFCRLTGKLTSRDDIRDVVKARLVERILKNRSLSSLDTAVRQMRHRMKWLESQRLKVWHHANRGNVIVIASGGLDLYLPELLRNLPDHTLICTKIGVTEKRQVDGTMPLGNCVRARKAERVAEFIKEHGPFEDSWGYGNSPDDDAMLALVKNATVI